MQKKRGISLIVLVITIIVMIILAAAIIISLNNTGIIGNANKAKDVTNEKTIVELANLAWGESYTQKKSEGKVASCNYYQKSIEDTLTKNGVDLSYYEVIAGDDGVQVFKKDDWAYAYTAKDGVWNDTKLEKEKNDVIPEDADIIVKFYKTDKIVEYKERYSGEDNEYYMVIEGTGAVPDLAKTNVFFSSIDDPVYAYMKGYGELIRTIYVRDGFAEAAKSFQILTTTHVKVCEGITSIGGGTFYGFHNLTSVTLPDSLNNIGTKNAESVFSEIILNNLIIPKNVTSMTTKFDENINNLYIETTSLSEIGSYTYFKGTIYVRNDAMKNLFESKIDSKKAKVSTDYNW